MVLKTRNTVFFTWRKYLEPNQQLLSLGKQKLYGCLDLNVISGAQLVRIEICLIYATYFDFIKSIYFKHVQGINTEK